MYCTCAARSPGSAAMIWRSAARWASVLPAACAPAPGDAACGDSRHPVSPPSAKAPSPAPRPDPAAPSDRAGRRAHHWPTAPPDARRRDSVPSPARRPTWAEEASEAAVSRFAWALQIGTYGEYRPNPPGKVRRRPAIGPERRHHTKTPQAGRRPPFALACGNTCH